MVNNKTYLKSESLFTVNREPLTLHPIPYTVYRVPFCYLQRWLNDDKWVDDALLGVTLLTVSR